MSADLKQLDALLAQCMTFDARRLRRRLRALRDASTPSRSKPRRKPSSPDSFDAILQDARNSAARRAERAARLPQPTFPPELPVSARHQEIAQAISSHQVVVLCGETGSGKTTQLPKICLSLGRGVSGLIGHTQPRRIAARSVAARIAHELRSPLARDVGFAIRFQDTIQPSAYVKLMTDGLLLAETQSDRLLEKYDTLIIDEAHERSLNIDFLLGYIKRILPRRPDLKLIITSATIDPARFSAHFNNAPVIEVSGRTYPIETRYQPVSAEDPDEDDPNLQDAIVSAVRTTLRETPGDTLVFLSGEREIRQTADALADARLNADVLPLYARLTSDEQQRVFEPHKKRRVILSTNIAETSVTVPAITAVVDPGFARISRYSPRTKVQGLPVERISQASADQRKGRCGRVAPGLCIRLFSEEDHRAQPAFTEPEILRSNLASVILQMKSLHLGDVEGFPFVDPPDARLIRDGLDTLLELGAIDETHHLTSLGQELARLPVDPRIARMLLAATREDCLAEVLIIASALAVQDPRVRPSDQQAAADTAHEQFRDETSDFLAILNLWKFWQGEKKQGASRARKACKSHFLSYVRLREWEDVHRQLRSMMDKMGYREAKDAAKPDAVHRALLTGLLSSIGKKSETREYQGPRDLRFFIFPGSGLFESAGKWVMAAELVRTSRLYARTIARIQPQWIERAAPHLVKKHTSDPRWSSERAEAVTTERVTLWGLEIISARPVPLSASDPKLARELFIHHALVEGDLQRPPRFLAHNLKLAQELQALEDKARRRDILADTQRRYDFYDKHIPPTVHSAHTLASWLDRASKSNPKLLLMFREDILAADASDVTEDRFPDALPLAETRAPLQYRFDPADNADGITITIPAHALSQLSADRAEWLTPGRLPEKIEELLRTLPKDLRRRLVPLPEIAQRFARDLPFAQGPLLPALAARVSAELSERISPDVFRAEALPEHLRMRFRVVDEKDKPLAEGRDLVAIRRSLGVKPDQGFGSADDPRFSRDRITSWDFGDLPDEALIRVGGERVPAFPALLDRGQSVSLRLLPTRAAADAATHQGLRRLFTLVAREDLKRMLTRIPNRDRLRLLASTIAKPADPDAAITERIAERAYLSDPSLPPIRSNAAFTARLDSGWNRLGPATDEVARAFHAALESRQRAAALLSSLNAPALAQLRVEAEWALNNLLPKDFLRALPWNALLSVPRYCAAIESRVRKATTGGLPRDAQNAAEWADWWRKYVMLRRDADDAGRISPALDRLRWLLEEYRVALFAQELGTSEPVSPKRLQRALDEASSSA